MSPFDPIYLDVPFTEKDEAKRLGARWNADRKKWYVPRRYWTERMRRWLPKGAVAPGEVQPEPKLMTEAEYTVQAEPVALPEGWGAW